MTHDNDPSAAMMRLWQEHLTRTLHDPKAADAFAPILQYWMSMMTNPSMMSGASHAAPYAPPPYAAATHGPAPTPPASDARADNLQQLTLRLDAAEKRIAALEAALGAATRS